MTRRGVRMVRDRSAWIVAAVALSAAVAIGLAVLGLLYFAR